MKLAMPAFGLMSGISTTVGFLPHILAMCFMAFFRGHPPPLMILVLFTLGAKMLCEWAFWGTLFSGRMRHLQNLQNWRESVNRSLLVQPTVVSSLLNILLDSIADVLLIYLALQTSTPPIWIFLGLFGCQAFAAPIHGVISDICNPRSCLMFSMIATVFAFVISMEIGKEMTRSGNYRELLGLYHFTSSTQMLIVVCVKGLLTSNTTISRAAIAECIKRETERQYS